MLHIEQLTGKTTALRAATLELQEFLRPCNYGTENDLNDANALMERVDTLDESISTIIAPLLTDTEMNHTEKTSAFNGLLCEHNITNKLDDVARDGLSLVMRQSCVTVVGAKDIRRGISKKIVNIDDTKLLKIYQRLMALNDLRISVLHESISPDKCDCGAQMEINPEDSQYICPACGYTKRVDGVIFRDDQSYAQNGHKMRANDYSAMRHLSDWLPKIFGEEKVDIPQNVFDKIRAVMVRDKETLDSISNVRKMRELLRDSEVMETKYNDHTTQIIKRMGGKGPYSPTDAERGLIIAKYKVIIMHYPAVAGMDANVTYCPYFVFKIIENFFADNPRMTNVLKYIHLQSQKTVTKNDETFEKIVERTDPSDGFQAIPTDREKYL